jgi:hypothetical protein
MGQYFSRFLSGPLRKLERTTAVTAHPMDSMWRTFLKSLRRIIEFVVRAIQLGPRHKLLLRSTAQLKDSKKGRIALVLGNGPSIRKINIRKVALEQQNKLDVFAVNWYPLTETGKLLTPDYLVLSDPAMKPNNLKDPRCAQLWNLLSEDVQTKIVVPTSWSKFFHRDSTLNSRIIYFNDLGLEGVSTNVTPTKPRGYLSLTVYKALAMATHFGFDDIFILGVDNTMFHGLSVTVNNEIMVGDHHFYAKQTTDQNMSNFYSNGVADYFYDISICFLHLRRCFGQIKNVYNLDFQSLVDCFQKRDPHHFCDQ